MMYQASGNALQETFRKDAQLFADGETHFATEDVVLALSDFSRSLR